MSEKRQRREKKRRKRGQRNRARTSTPRPIREYVLALDESGQPHIRDPALRRYGFIEGGIVVPCDRVQRLEERLAAIKSVIGHASTEAKAHEVATGFGGFGEVADFEHALVHVCHALEDCGAFLAGAFLDKAAFFGSPSGGLMHSTAKGGVRVNQGSLFETITLAFGQFLERNNGCGFVIHDELGSPNVQEAWRTSLVEMGKEFPKASARIVSVDFVDSKDSAPIQMADITIGLLRSHFEARTALRKAALVLIQRATRHGLLFNVQP